MNEVIAAVITGVITLTGVLIANSKSQAVTDTKLDELTREVREHNTLIARVPVLEEQLKVANHRIEDLESEVQFSEKGGVSMNKIKVSTLTRTAVLILALTNQILSATGHSPIPVDDAQLEQLISTGMTVAAAIWAWWENNSFTKDAIAADNYLESLIGRKEK